MLTNAPKGTKDILPNQVYKWHYVEKTFADICLKYGFKEIRTPIFEHTELFTRGVGDTTDIVEKQMYTFDAVSYTHLRAHETRHDLVCRLLLEKKKPSIVGAHDGRSPR